jgi:hypothetical protein
VPLQCLCEVFKATGSALAATRVIASCTYDRSTLQSAAHERSKTWHCASRSRELPTDNWVAHQQSRKQSPVSPPIFLDCKDQRTALPSDYCLPAVEPPLGPPWTFLRLHANFPAAILQLANPAGKSVAASLRNTATVRPSCTPTVVLRTTTERDGE